MTTEQEEIEFENWREEFIKRAGFNHTWKDLESWARRMVEQAYVEQCQTKQQVFDEPYACFTCGSKVENHNCISHLLRTIDDLRQELANANKLHNP